MNNEPVAWMDANDKTIISNEKKWANDIPLYTHPHSEESVKAKTLTDEEIIKTMVQFDVYSADDQCLIEAGRAILRKANEK